MIVNHVKLAPSEAIRVSDDPTTASSEANNASPKLILAYSEAIFSSL